MIPVLQFFAGSTSIGVVEGWEEGFAKWNEISGFFVTLLTGGLLLATAGVCGFLLQLFGSMVTWPADEKRE
jgi:hypothetical protein